MNPVNLLEVERVEVTVLVDNYTDLLLLQSTPVARRAPVLPPKAFLAEHGFSCLIKTVDVEEHVVLMDVGISGTCLLHNAELLKIDLGRVEALILSTVVHKFTNVFRLRSGLLLYYVAGS